MDLSNRRTGKDTTKPRTLGLFGHSVSNIWDFCGSNHIQHASDPVNWDFIWRMPFQHTCEILHGGILSNIFQILHECSPCFHLMFSWKIIWRQPSYIHVWFYITAMHPVYMFRWLTFYMKAVHPMYMYMRDFTWTQSVQCACEILHEGSPSS